MIIAENLDNTKSKGKRYKNIKVNKPQFPDLQITTMNILTTVNNLDCFLPVSFLCLFSALRTHLCYEIVFPSFISLILTFTLVLIHLIHLDQQVNIPLVLYLVFLYQPREWPEMQKHQEIQKDGYKCPRIAFFPGEAFHDLTGNMRTFQNKCVQMFL